MLTLMPNFPLSISAKTSVYIWNPQYFNKTILLATPKQWVCNAVFPLNNPFRIMKTIKILFILLFLGFTPIMAQKDSTSQKADDEELNLPEGMQENTDSLINAWNMSKFFQWDTTSQLADINPYFEKAVYIDRLKRIPSIMELSYNDIVQKYID